MIFLELLVTVAEKFIQRICDSIYQEPEREERSNYEKG